MGFFKYFPVCLQWFYSFECTARVLWTGFFIFMYFFFYFLFPNMSWFLVIQYGCWTEVYFRPYDRVVLQRQNLPATGRAAVFVFSVLGFVPLPAQPWPNVVRAMKGASEGSWGREISTFLYTSFVQQSNCHPSPWEKAEEHRPSAHLPPIRPTSSMLALSSPLPLPRSSCLPDMSCRPVQDFGFSFCS